MSKHLRIKHKRKINVRAKYSNIYEQKNLDIIQKSKRCANIPKKQFMHEL